jgi:hypothetical protein
MPVEVGKHTTFAWLTTSHPGLTFLVSFILFPSPATKPQHASPVRQEEIKTSMTLLAFVTRPSPATISSVGNFHSSSHYRSPRCCAQMHARLVMPPPRLCQPRATNPITYGPDVLFCMPDRTQLYPICIASLQRHRTHAEPRVGVRSREEPSAVGQVLRAGGEWRGVVRRQLPIPHAVVHLEQSDTVCPI